MWRGQWKRLLNREKEVADVLRGIENNEKLFVFSERRYGKISLVQTALGKLLKMRPQGTAGDAEPKM